MSKLKEKSNFNIIASKLLIDNQYYAPSIHCSYFSCFQLMKYSINKVLKVEYDELSTKIRNSELNTHNYVINTISDTVLQQFNKYEYREFNNKIKDLKQYRIEADYNKVEIDLSQSKKAHDIAIEIIEQLKKLK